LHTCYTPWPVFRDVTDSTGLITTLLRARRRQRRLPIRLEWRPPGRKVYRAHSNRPENSSSRKRIVPEKKDLPSKLAEAAHEGNVNGRGTLTMSKAKRSTLQIQTLLVTSQRAVVDFESANSDRGCASPASAKRISDCTSP